MITGCLSRHRVFLLSVAAVVFLFMAVTTGRQAGWLCLRFPVLRVLRLCPSDLHAQARLGVSRALTGWKRPFSIPQELFPASRPVETRDRLKGIGTRRKTALRLDCTSFHILRFCLTRICDYTSIVLPIKGSS